MSDGDQPSISLKLNADYSKTDAHVWQYGTAGFRDKASKMRSLAYRVGISAALRSVDVSGAIVGVMVTASHNPLDDNGAKIIDPRGNMLAQAWEGFVTQIANVPDDDVMGCVMKISTAVLSSDFASPRVYVARDTRPSSAELSQAVIAGVQSVQAGKAHDYGLLSTPQLHYLVRSANRSSAETPPDSSLYPANISDAFLRFFSLAVAKPTDRGVLRVDCANGIGGGELFKSFKERLSSVLTLEEFNDGCVEKLNDQCGADFVKVQQRAPVVHNGSAAFVPGERYASFDGDADRLVYYFFDKDGAFRLLDGDRIATLVAHFLKETLQKAGILDSLSIGIVQTSYANGASTRYISEVLGVQTECVPTGVKHLHHAAEQFDIGVYFEANGHGTVLFSKRFYQIVAEREDLCVLEHLPHFVNQAVGDAMSDLLLVEGVLAALNWNMEQWHGMYADLSSRQLKVNVPDRRVVRTMDSERRVYAPEGLQEAIDASVAAVGLNARAFVRPSGTEDVVRVYAEADSQDVADRLAETVAGHVKKLCSEEN